MGVEDFYEFQRLIGRPYTAAGPAYDAEVRDAGAWEAANQRFVNLLDAWFRQPLVDAGFRDKGQRWVYGRGAVRPVLDVQRHRGAQVEEGLIDFTVNWAVWVQSFARRVSEAKRLAPQTAQAPFHGRVGQLMGKGEYDVWWVVTPERVVRHMPPRAEPDPPSAHDEVPEMLRTRLIPMLTAIDTLPKTISAIRGWTAAGIHSVMQWAFDPVAVLEEIARAQDVKQDERPPSTTPS